MENFDFDDNIVVLVVSDVHLGASGAYHDDFITFLRNLNSKKKEGNLKHLKAILILGDFFDLCMDSYKDLSNEDTNLLIYDNLIDLQNQNINILITLGNHEIDVTGNYDKQFKSRKNKFIQAFQNHFTTREKYRKFFNDIYFCQYCILQKNQSNQLEISLFDSKEKFANNGKSEQKVKLEVHSEMDSKHKYLFAHGYQFEPWYIYLFFASSIWKAAIESDDLIKESLNILYNELYKRTEKTSKKTIQKYTEDPDIKELFSTRKINIEDIPIEELVNMMKKIEKSEKRREKIKLENKRYFKKIFRFLKKQKYSHLSHVIFAHTHQEDEDKKNNKHIFNTGAWQNVVIPHFIEILVNGEINLRRFE